MIMKIRANPMTPLIQTRFPETMHECILFINSATKNLDCILCLQVESSDRSSLSKLVESVKTNYNERGEEIKRHWGGGSLGNKSAAKVI